MSENFEIRSQREPGHYWKDNEIFDNYALSGSAMLLYDMFCRYANNKLASLFYSQRKFCEIYRLGDIIAKDALTELIDKKLVIISGFNAKGCRNIILLKIDKSARFELTAKGKPRGASKQGHASKQRHASEQGRASNNGGVPLSSDGSASKQSTNNTNNNTNINNTKKEGRTEDSSALLEKEKRINLLCIKIQDEIVEKGYRKLYGEKLVWTGQSEKYKKYSKQITEMGIQVSGGTDDDVIEVVKLRARNLYEKVKVDPGSYWKFDYQWLATHWNNLATIVDKTDSKATKTANKIMEEINATD